MFYYREIKQEDFESVSELLIQLGYNVSKDELKFRMARITANEKGNVFVALSDSAKIIGCVQALIDTRLAGGNFGEVVSLIVDEKYRGNGIGKNLIDKASEWLKSKGERRLRIRCNIIRDETHRFYQHLGFSEKKSQKIFEKMI